VDASGGQALEVALCSWGTGRSVLLGTGSSPCASEGQALLRARFGQCGTGDMWHWGQALIWRYSSRGTGGQALEVALGTGSRTSFGGAGVEDRSWIGLGSAL